MVQNRVGDPKLAVAYVRVAILSDISNLHGVNRRGGVFDETEKRPAFHALKRKYAETGRVSRCACGLTRKSLARAQGKWIGFPAPRDCGPSALWRWPLLINSVGEGQMKNDQEEKQ